MKTSNRKLSGPARFWLPALLLLCSTIAAQTRPNIVLIVADDQGYADLGCFGGPEIKTPHLDKMAAEGARATSFYVAWPACTPSRGAVMTGRYPQRNGLYDMIRNDMVNYGHRYTEIEYSISPEMTLGLDLREITLAKVLKESGYATGVVGKWDSGRARRFLPLQRGFDFFYGFCNTGIDYWTHERYGIPSMFRGNERTEEDKGTFCELVFRREALRFIHENKDGPFFLYLPFFAPHGESNLERSGIRPPREHLDLYPDRDPQNRRTQHMAVVSLMDETIGLLFQTLKDLGLDDNTLVMFFSDNGGGGPGDNRPLRGRKAQMFEGGIRVPFIAWWPEKIPAGAVSSEFLTALEVFPTLVAVGGAEAPDGVILDGFDMLPVLQGKTRSPRAEMFWERRLDKAARVENWKWVDSQHGQGLFDLSSDISEKQDLSEERPEILAKLRARFAAWKKEMDEAEPRGPFRNY